ncbi:MAG: hypothetical protein IPJ41_15050 [Phycisphaerales bacterium]|nr:hypothetical protein [Phycisphaerales bacterium]
MLDRRRSTRPLMLLAALTAAAMLGACAETQTVCRVGPPRRASWQAVLPGPVVVEASSLRGHPSWIDGRRNESLSAHTERPLLATTAWPERERPTLSRPRVIWVPRSPDHYLYYRSEHRGSYERHSW